MATTVVTGANKGIGLGLAAQLKARGENVIAVCRRTSPELSALGVRIIEGIDVSDPAAVERLKGELEGQEIDVLINNAGIMTSDKFGHLNYDSMIEQFRVNTLGPLRITEALIDNLHKDSKVIIITSRVGSIEDNQSGGYYGYRASKTAVNQMGMNLAHELRQLGIAVALLHPGMVATELTGGRGISVTESANGLIARIDELTIQDSGCFRHAEGYKLPW
jgi:short-subunit dehydrogenase